LGEEDSSKQEREGEQFLFHQGTLCRVLAISEVSSESIRYRSSWQVNCARPNVERCKNRNSGTPEGLSPPEAARARKRSSLYGPTGTRPGATRSFLATAAGVRW
jgi:hypothetical protein